jgi:hypothetical protein
LSNLSSGLVAKFGFGEYSGTAKGFRAGSGCYTCFAGSPFMHCLGTEIYFCTTKPARIIWTYFVRKMFHGCIIFTFLVVVNRLFVGIAVYLLAIPESFHGRGALSFITFHLYYYFSLSSLHGFISVLYHNSISSPVFLHFILSWSFPCFSYLKFLLSFIRIKSKFEDI